MDHDSLKELIFTKGGERTAAEAAALSSHLAACPSCRELSARWAGAAPVMFPRGEAVPSDAFVRAVMDRVAEEPVPAGFFARWGEFFSPRQWATVGAAAALAATAAFVLPRPRPGVSVAEEAVFIGELMEDPVSDEAALDTAVEDYFLV